MVTHLNLGAGLYSTCILYFSGLREPYMLLITLVSEKKKIYLFILAVLGLRCCAGFPLVEASRVYSLAAVLRLLLLWSRGSRVHRLPQLWLAGSRARAQ